MQDCASSCTNFRGIQLHSIHIQSKNPVSDVGLMKNNLCKKTCETCKFLVQVDLYQFLQRVLRALLSLKIRSTTSICVIYAPLIRLRRFGAIRINVLSNDGSTAAQLYARSY